MFDSNQHEDLLEQLPKFSLDESSFSFAPMSLPLQFYLEFYGFFEAMKGLELEYFFGTREVRVESAVKGKDCKIATHYWQLPSPKATVFVVHGLYDHVGLFQKVIRFLLVEGYSVIAIDLPGHGLSDGESTKIGRFDDYAYVVTDALTFFESELGDRPRYGLGQSTGAAVLMCAEFKAHSTGKKALFDKLVFLGPLVRPRLAWVAYIAYLLLGRIMPSIARETSRPNSNDADFHLFLSYQDPLQARRLSIDWIRAMFLWVKQFNDQPVIDVPLLILQGTRDKVVDWRFNVPEIRKHFRNSQVGYIKGAMHHLANEAEPWLKVVFSGMGGFFRRPSKSTK